MRYWSRNRPAKIPGNPLVEVLAAAYVVEDERLRDALACFVYSMRAQTWRNWKLKILHDGPGSGMFKFFSGLHDPRVEFQETAERRGKFGHPWRQQAIAASRGDYITLTNADNYYAPVFVEAMLGALVHQRADFAYCNFVHSHQNWKFFKSEPRKSKLDLGAWMARGDLVRGVPFDSFEFNGDGQYIDRLTAKAGKIVKLDQSLLVHN